ncbi:hypothetical protein L6452_31921 [Arctium lappa]|uniref:Uncharacterized protein n=1 Tax=Arctium lappa TaxID=4217 RepID=A0ACB8Z3I6_ARCLA|nr:hypothetical protein L6452_31921 [Arctium lappa]
MLSIMFQVAYVEKGLYSPTLLTLNPQIFVSPLQSICASPSKLQKSWLFLNLSCSTLIIFFICYTLIHRSIALFAAAASPSLCPIA